MDRVVVLGTHFEPLVQATACLRIFRCQQNCHEGVFGATDDQPQRLATPFIEGDSKCFVNSFFKENKMKCNSKIRVFRLYLQGKKQSEKIKRAFSNFICNAGHVRRGHRVAFGSRSGVPLRIFFVILGRLLGRDDVHHLTDRGLQNKCHHRDHRSDAKSSSSSDYPLVGTIFQDFIEPSRFICTRDRGSFHSGDCRCKRSAVKQMLGLKSRPSLAETTSQAEAAETSAHASRINRSRDSDCSITTGNTTDR